MYHISDKGRNRFSGAVWSALCTALGLALLLSIGPLSARAEALASVAQGQGLNSVTIPAGATASLTVRAFCLDFGKPFPTDNTATNGLADDKIRAALNYSIQKGYTEGNPAQVELAVWFLMSSSWHDVEHTVAQEIVDNATTANVPATSGDGLSLSDAVAQNKVTLEAKFVAQTVSHFYGDTTLQIKNTGTSDIKIYMPVGTVFTVPNGGGKFQDLAAYALGPQGTQQAASATATTEPTMTAAPTVTVATAMPTATAIATVAAATPTAMSAPVTNTLPQTGSPSGGNGGIVSILVALAALMLIVLGLVMRPEQSKR